MRPIYLHFRLKKGDNLRNASSPADPVPNNRKLPGSGTGEVVLTVPLRYTSASAGLPGSPGCTSLSAKPLVGAEKLPERLALAFEDTFGIRPLEG